MRLRDLFKINFSSFMILVMGFCTSLLIPKIVISSVGINHYGSFAVILGICLIPSFFEFGLTPALTREAGTLYANKNYNKLYVLISKFQQCLGLISFTAVFAAAFITAEKRLITDMDWVNSFCVVMCGGGANAIVLMTEIGAIRIRIAGQIIPANIARMTYYFVYIFTVVGLAFLKSILVNDVFLAQLLSACIYYLTVSYITERHYKKIKNTGSDETFVISWRMLALMSLPDQINRAQSSLIPSMERQFIFQTGGAQAISAYDIALRLSALVTSFPAELASPLVALLSPNKEKGNHSENRFILRYTNFFTWGIVTLNCIIVFFIIKYFAIKFYHLENTPFIFFAGFILIGSTVNVLTASSNAFLYAHNTPVPIIIKSLSDFVLAIVAISAMVYYRSPFWFIVIRYMGYCLTASMFLLYCNFNFEKYQNEKNKQRR